MRRTRTISSFSARAQSLGPCRIEMQELGVAAEHGVGGGEPAFKIREGRADQHVDLGHVLNMDMRVGVGDARAERRDRLRAVAGAIIGVAGGGKIGAAKIVAVRPVAAQRAIADAEAVSSVGGAENAAQIVCAFQRIEYGFFVERGDGAHRVVEKRDEVSEHVAKQTRDLQRHVDARKLEPRLRQNFEADDSRARRVPMRRDAQKRQRLREILAAGADRRAAPQIEHDMAREFAMLLRMAHHHFRGCATPDVVSRLRRRMARIDAIEVAACRQNVGASARRRAGRPGLDEAARKR